MRYSLQSRFQGAFLGAAVGESLGVYSSGKSRTDLQALRLGVQWHFAVPPASHLLQPGWGHFAIAQCQYLLESINIQQPKTPLTVPNDRYFPTAIGAALPVSLFFHEDWQKLQQQLNRLSALYQLAPDLDLGILALGYALTRALKEKLEPSKLMPQILTQLRHLKELEASPASPASPASLASLASPASPAPVIEQFTLIQTLLEQGADLETAVNQLTKAVSSSNLPIALAFYCFLTTPEDFPLTVLRAVRTAYQPQLTGAIAGAISGAYNSLAGIPPHWRIALDRPELANSSLHACWGLASTQEILQLSLQLLVAWSGAYEPTGFGDLGDRDYAIAAPYSLRRR